MDRPQAPPPIDVRSLAITGIFVLLVFHTLHTAAALLLPICLALMAYFALAPLVRGLARVRVPPALGAGFVLIVLAAGLGLALNWLVTPAAEWVERAPASLRKIEQKLRFVREPMEQLAEATETVEDMAAMPRRPGTQTVAVRRATLADIVLTQTRSALAMTAVVVVLLYFLLASGDMLLAGTARAAPRLGNGDSLADLLRVVEADVSRYLLTISCINVCLGLLVAGMTYLLGLPSPLLWGALAAVLNFVPFLGPTVTALVLAAVSLLTFDAPSEALAAPLLFLALTGLEGFFLTPALLGRRLTLNPVAVFTSLLVWSWLWGVPGMLIAVPLLAVVKIAADRVEALQPLGMLIGR